MAKIIEYRDIPLDSLILGKGQVRTKDIGQGIDELAQSIKVQGLLQPIVVCKAQEEEKWEILTGQRRFLACKQLNQTSIPAAILDQRVEEAEAKAISITENLIRRQLSGKELIDGITFLYNKYGSNAKYVSETTGLPYNDVRQYVKYPRLIPELKKMVDDGEIDVRLALKAQDSASDEGTPDPEVAVTLAKEMESMSGAQQKKVVQERKKNPEKPVEDVIEEAKTGSKVVQIVATITQDTHNAIKQFASEEGTNQDEATVALIEEALTGRGLLQD